MMSRGGKERKYQASTWQVPERRTQEHTHHHLLPWRLGSHTTEEGDFSSCYWNQLIEEGVPDRAIVVFPASAISRIEMSESQAPSALHQPCSVYLTPEVCVYGRRAGWVPDCRGFFFFFFLLVVSLPLFIKNITLWTPTAGIPGPRIWCSLTLPSKGRGSINRKSRCLKKAQVLDGKERLWLTSQ